MASTTPEPLGPYGEWAGRRVIVQQVHGAEVRGMVQSASQTMDGRLAYLVLQLPEGGAPVHVPANSVLSVQPDGWSEALSRANLDFQTGGDGG